MPAKKGKGKKDASGKKNADVARLALLRAQEAEAENFLRLENERRQRDELEERMTFLREEQTRAMAQKESQLQAVTDNFHRLSAKKAEEKAQMEHEAQQLRQHRDVLLNQDGLAKTEMAELAALLQQERTTTATQLEQLRDTMEKERRSNADLRERLRGQSCEALAQSEVLRQRLERTTEEKDLQERSFRLRQRELERDLEKALATSTTLRQALEERDAGERKNVTLLQLLNSQLESDMRRHEEEMTAEQERTRAAAEDADRFRAKAVAAHTALEAERQAAQSAQQSASVEVQELRGLLEQVQFDAAYLHRELDTLTSEHQAAAEKAAATTQRLQRELHACQVDLEAAARETAEVKAAALRREREHFDQVTFLNAQVSNGRTTAAQLREELSRLRANHTSAIRAHEAAHAESTRTLQQRTEAEAEREKARHDYTQSVLADMTALKKSAEELQAQLAARDDAYAQLRTDTSDEIARLRALLDAHFIPNRKDVEVARESVNADLLYAVKEELRTFREKAAERDQARQETETWLRTRVAEQMDIIAALQADLRRSQHGSSEDVRSLENEVGRLRKTLEVHQISCT